MVKKVMFLLAASFSLGHSVLADDTIESLRSSLDMSWIMIAAFLVFFMHAGFAMVETGFTRSKNALNILMKNLLTMSIGSVIFFIVGFGIMFGHSAQGVIGTDGFFLAGFTDQVGFFLFQAVFAATCATIISGAVAERMKLSSYMMLTVIMTSLIYPIVGHWVWGGGWLSELGFTDFAGSSVVHLTGAIGAIVAVVFLGARIGKYSGTKINVIPGHNIPLGALGIFILWFGWFGFNGGSTLSADPALVPHVVAVTLLSGACGVVVTALYTLLRYKRIDASLTLNGALAGLVGITAGCAEVSLLGSIFIGGISGVLLVESVRFIDRKVKLDDPVGAIAVHGIGGIWGTLAVGLFSTSKGLIYTGDASSLGIQAVGILAVIIWTTLSVSLTLYLLTRFSSIRVSREEEIAGLDFTEHGSSAYELRESILSEVNEEFPTSFGNGLVNRLNQLGTPSRTNET